jgi:PmbA protein
VDLRDFARDLVARALAAGARAADAVVTEGDGLVAAVRMGEVEKLKRARQRRAGLRVFLGDSTAIVSTADFSPAGLRALASDACGLARVTAPDPHAGLPEPADLVCEATLDLPALDLYDPALEELDPRQALAWARDAEAAALAASREVTNSEGAEFGGDAGRVAYASSLDCVADYAGSHASLAVVPVATRNGAMQRDSWYTAHRKLAGLEPPAAVGREAARRTLRRLGARRAPTTECPVVFDAETAATLLRHLAGPALYRRMSFLLDQLGEVVASPAVTIVDDPLRPAGPASRPFDGEGVAQRRRVVVERGVLATYLLDSYSARRLGLRTTGHAARAAGDGPSAGPTNFFLVPGPHAPDAIIASVRSGLYVTELIGFGVNPVTGDYSRGAAGLWIENGELAYPVEEITIAGNLRRILQDIEMVGNDLRMQSAISSPTLKVARMTVAGT